MMKLLTLFSLLPAALALDLTLYLPATPNPFTLPSTTHATLSSLSQHHAAPLTTVNTFVFRNVSHPESYLVDIYCPTTGFQPLRIDVAADGTVQAWDTFRGNEWDNKGEVLEVKEASGGRGVEIKALGVKNYFAERPRFSVMTILKNPMILMGLASMVMFIGMPYLMDNMDPEMKAEFEQRQRQGPLSVMSGGGGGQKDANPLGNFDMAGYLAGSSKKESGSGNGGGNGNGGNKNQGVKR